VPVCAECQSSALRANRRHRRLERARMESGAELLAEMDKRRVRRWLESFGGRFLCIGSGSAARTKPG
jgi:hypothetical protein